MPLDVKSYRNQHSRNWHPTAKSNGKGGYLPTLQDLTTDEIVWTGSEPYLDEWLAGNMALFILVQYRACTIDFPSENIVE